jgi:phage host-nuclease inhibitor protein Gam
MSDEELQADLDAWAMGEAASDDPEALEPPRDVDQAERLLRARAGMLRELGRLEQFAERQIREIAAWRDDRTSGLRRRLAGVEKILEQWFRAVNRDEPKRKTEKLPHGTVKLRERPYSVEVTDEEALRGWLWSNRPDLLDITVKPKAGQVKAAFEPGPVVSEHEDVVWHAVMAPEGEVVPGIVLTKPTADKFSVD